MAHVVKSTGAPLAATRLNRPPLLATTVGISVGMLLIALAWPALTGRVYVADDLGGFHLPARAFYSEALKRGESFDWCPHLFGGFYLTGEGQVGAYHPLHLALYWALPLQVAFNLELLLSYPLMLAGGYFWLRRRIPRGEAAMFGAMLLTFGGFNLLHLAHLNAVAVVAHIPWILWAIDVAACEPKTGRRAAASAAISLLVASQLLLGYPQYVWYSLLVSAAYLAWLLRANGPARAVPHPRRAWTTWLTIGTAMLIGVLLGGIQLLPTLEALNASVRRDAGVEFANSGSLHPWNLVQLVAPYMFKTRVVGQNTHELGLYAGCVPLVLCAWLWLRRRELGSLGPVAGAAAGLAVVSLWLATGEHGYLYRLQTWLPVVGKFRFPCRAITLFHLSTAVLAAVAIATLAVRRPRQQAASLRQYWALWAIGLSSLAAALIAPILWPQHVASWPHVLAGPILIGLTIWLVWLADRNNRWALSVLVILATVDLGWYGLSYSVHDRTARLDELIQRHSAPPAGAPTRILSQLPNSSPHVEHHGNQDLLAGWSRIDGYAGLEPARQLDYRHVASLRAAGVGFVRRSPESEQITGLVPHDEHLLRVPDPVPAAYLVRHVIASNDPGHDLASIDPATTALVEPKFLERNALSPGTPGSVEVTDERFGHWALRVDCDSPQLLVLTQTWHAGWDARVDGRTVPVWRVNGDFLGCVVPAGAKRVDFVFHPDSLAHGAVMSGCGLSLWLIGLVLGWRASGRSNRKTLVPKETVKDECIQECKR